MLTRRRLLWPGPSGSFMDFGFSAGFFLNSSVEELGDQRSHTEVRPGKQGNAGLEKPVVFSSQKPGKSDRLSQPALH